MWKVLQFGGCSPQIPRKVLPACKQKSLGPRPQRFLFTRRQYLTVFLCTASPKLQYLPSLFVDKTVKHRSRAKMSPRWCQGEHRWRQDEPRWRQDDPKWARMEPRSAKMEARWAVRPPDRPSARATIYTNSRSTALAASYYVDIIHYGVIFLKFWLSEGTFR